MKKEGLPRLLDGQERFPFVVVSPQLPRGRDWPPDALEAFVDLVLSRHPADPERVSLAGISSGALAALELAGRQPGRYAAVVAAPVPGVPAAPCSVRAAVWLFHNRDDGRVPLRVSNRVSAALRSCGVHVRQTVYPAGGHDCWSAAFASRSLYEWLSAMRRPGSLALPPRPS